MSGGLALRRAGRYRDTAIKDADSAAWHGNPAGVSLLVISTVGLAQTFIGPMPYLSKNDSPFIVSMRGVR